MRPRPYQVKCIGSLVDGFAHHNSLLAVLATGLGKTVIFSLIAARWPSHALAFSGGGRVIVVAHREELISQAADKITAADGQPPGVEMGAARVDEGNVCFKPRVIVSSVQTMSRPDRLAKFNPADFGLLVIDEAHHAVSPTYRRVINFFRRNERLKVLGVTATPRRADDLAMGQVFDAVAFDYGIEPAVGDGWLVPVRQQVVKVEGLDFSTARTLGGDFNEADLERILTEEGPLHAVASPTVDLSGDHPALVFCVTVNHARLLAAVLNRYKPRSAAFLSGETDRQTRRDTVAAYKAGKLQFLCNCGLFLEGFDAPNTAFVVMARPTKSLPLYVQILGRGTRPLPGVVDNLPVEEPGAERPHAPEEAGFLRAMEEDPCDPAHRLIYADWLDDRGDGRSLRKAAIARSAKPYMTVLDFVGNSGRHKIVTAADVLGGRWAAPVRQYAHQNLEREGRPVPVEEAMERAAAEMAFEAALQARRQRIKASAAYRTHEVSPFSGGGTATCEPPRPAAGPRATDRQVALLVKLGVAEPTARGYGRRQASAVIDNLMDRQGWRRRER